MPATESTNASNCKMAKRKDRRSRFRVPKGERIVIQAHAKAQGETTTAFIKRAIREAMERDNAAK